MLRRLVPLVVANIIMLLGALPCARASDLNIDHTYGDKIGGWTIGYSDTLEGCIAANTYVDQTTIWLGLRGGQQGAYLAFTNPSWRWLEVGKTYEVQLSAVPYSNWKGTFRAIERGGGKGLAIVGMSWQFRYDVARAENIIVYVQQFQIANLNLNDSTGALLAAAECAAQRSAIAKQPPSPEQNIASSGTGFIVSSSSTGGYILTNHHVVKGCSTVQISWEDETPHQGQVINTDERNDLALIWSGRTLRTQPAFRLGARVGDTVEVYGFPLAGFLVVTSPSAS